MHTPQLLACRVESVVQGEFREGDDEEYATESPLDDSAFTEAWDDGHTMDFSGTSFASNSSEEEDEIDGIEEVLSAREIPRTSSQAIPGMLFNFYSGY